MTLVISGTVRVPPENLERFKLHDLSRGSQSEPQGLSHRARAFVKLAKGCLAQIPGASAAAGRR